MLKFPVPRWHELDGGRYIGTDDLVITRDPEEKLGKRRHLPDYGSRPGSPGTPHVAGKTWAGSQGKISSTGKIVSGGGLLRPSPINFVVASTDVPNRVNEYDYAGGILAGRCKWSKVR